MTDNNAIIRVFVRIEKVAQFYGSKTLLEYLLLQTKVDTDPPTT